MVVQQLLHARLEMRVHALHVAQQVALEHHLQGGVGRRQHGRVAVVRAADGDLQRGPPRAKTAAVRRISEEWAHAPHQWITGARAPDAYVVLAEVLGNVVAHADAAQW